MELINAPLVAMVPKQIGLLKIEIEQMSVKYFAIKAHLNPLVYHYCCIIRLFCDPTEISVRFDSLLPFSKWRHPLHVTTVEDHNVTVLFVILVLEVWEIVAVLLHTNALAVVKFALFRPVNLSQWYIFFLGSISLYPQILSSLEL